MPITKGQGSADVGDWSDYWVPHHLWWIEKANMVQFLWSPNALGIVEKGLQTNNVKRKHECSNEVMASEVEA